MSKNLKVVNESTGEILEGINFSGGYNIQYSNYEDDGSIIHIKHLNNAKFGEKYWIKNEFYQPIVRKLVSKFKEINFIKADKILFLENMDWEPKGDKKSWIAKTVKANTQFSEFTGYDFIILTKEYYIDKMSEEQVVLLIYHELRHIDEDGGLKDHDIEDWDNIIATFGTQWAETQSAIDNILDGSFKGWQHLRKVKGKQISMFDNVTPIKRAEGE